MALVVFTGGVRSGKSSAALRLARTRAGGDDVTVVAFGRKDIDVEFAERVADHRTERPSGWTTLEAADSRGWMAQVPDDGLVVLDCLGTLVGLAMEESFEATGVGVLGDADAIALPSGFEAAVHQRLDDVLRWILSRECDTIVVTNEVGDGIVPEYATGRFFRDALGRANRRIVDGADAAYLCVAGRLVDLLGLPRDARWPVD